jgi:2-iminobutanoate/2-iminopropanoate deaminase
MDRKTIATDGAPGAIGPYSQAVLAGGWLWCSGQIALNAATGMLVGEGRDADAARAQTRQVLMNLRAVVEEAGATLADVVKCTVFVADMDHFAAVNEVYAEFFTAAPPARATVEVSRLPKDVLVEIDCVARVE